MNDLKLGEFLTGKTGYETRDATHVAIIAVEAAHIITPGQPIQIDERYKASVDFVNYLGIADPFLVLKNVLHIKKGDKFWCFLTPGTVNGMKHHWTHPSFKEGSPQKLSVNEHKQWLLDFCERWYFDFHELISCGIAGKGYVTSDGIECSESELGEDYYNFWHHLEGYTGQTFDDNHRGGVGWSCSC